MVYSAGAGQRKVRVFTSFDFDHDENLKILLMGQANNLDSPFEIADWSVREPMTGDWKAKVRTRIKRTQQVIVMCGEHTHTAAGVNAEVLIAQEERINYFLLSGHADRNCFSPPAARNDTIYPWTWDNLKQLIHGRR